MKALVCPAFGGPSALEFRDVPAPVPGAGEVRIRIEAAGVNYPDILSVAGTYPVKSEPPFIPGIEGAGTVVECGPGVARIKAGDRVCWQNNRVKGTFAEEIVLPEAGLSAIPDAVPFAIAAITPTVYGTAWFALNHRGQLQPGEVLVVHGASGGTGLAAVQVGKMMGATVIATGADDAKLARVREAGADYVVNHRAEAVRDRILELTGGRGADVYFDPVGGDLFDASLRAIARYGRILVIGFTSGRFAEARTNILLIKGVSVIGANYGRYLEHERDAARAEMDRIVGWIAEGKLAPRLDRTFPLAKGAAALLDVLDRKVVGKYALLTQQH
jgi:NADPH2:quinone reductase